MGGRLETALGHSADLVVIGGGIYGACLAREAASRGARVALVERFDFAGGASGQSLRILHGGLRYLQHADFPRMRRSIRARRDWMRRFGDLVTPMAFALPTFGHGLRGREAFAAALALNDIVSLDRNRGLPAGLRLPSGRSLSRSKTADLYDGFRVDGFNGAALWHDALSVDSEAILLRVLGEAHRAGVRIANYAEARRILVADDDGTVSRVQLVDANDGTEHEVSTAHVIVAAGPASGRILRDSGIEPHGEDHFSLGINLVLRGVPVPHGLGVPVRREGRDSDAVVDSGTNSVFFVPWRGHTLVGTRHFSIGPAEAKPEILRDCVARFLEEIGGLRPQPSWPAQDDVVAVLAGWLPEAGPLRPDRDPVLAKHARIERYLDGGTITSVVGVKWTTADAVARTVIDRVMPHLGEAKRGAGTTAGDSAARGVDRNTEPALPTREEVVRQIREEWVVRLSDLVLRRNSLWARANLADEELDRLAGWAAAELGWDETERARQLEATRRALAQRRGPRSTEGEEPV